MLRIKYYKDLQHNYLIIRTRITEAAQSYQHSMITGNKMKNILTCSIKYIDEECHFYYEISSMQNLVSLFDKKEMAPEQIGRLLECMQEAAAELENFLLDSRCLLTEPNYIYSQAGTEEYFFLYYPYYMEEKEEMPLMPLMEFLVEKMNHDNAEAAAAIYKMYELAQDDKFILSEAIKLLDCSEQEEHLTKEWEKREIPAEKKEFSAESIGNPLGEEEDLFEEYGAYGAYGEGETPRFGNVALTGILSFLCMAGAAGIFAIGYFFELSMNEKILSAAGIVILIVLSALLFLRFILHALTRKPESRRGKLEEEATAPFPGSLLREDHSDGSSTYSDNTFLANAYSENGLESGKRKPGGIQKSLHTGAEPEDYGNTVFLETSAYQKENKLYGTNKGNKYHIDLSRLPCTIGKMAGSVDVIIKDSTISRIHARLSKENEEIYVTDLNSTNGTYKNGLRLEPNETALIEPGDELRFGRMTFSYR